MSDVIVGLLGVYAMIGWLIFFDADGHCFRALATALAWPLLVVMEVLKVLKDYWGD